MGTRSKRVLLTDITFRDAHQSLLATRIRTKDLPNCRADSENVTELILSRNGAVQRLMLHIVS